MHLFLTITFFAALYTTILSFTRFVIWMTNKSYNKSTEEMNDDEIIENTNIILFLNIVTILSTILWSILFYHFL